MENYFSPEDIKASVEYQWRKQSIQSSLLLFAFLLIIFFFVVLFMSISENIDLSSLCFVLGGCLISIGLCGSPLLISAILDYRKMRYLLRHYQQFHSYEVVLDKVSTSYTYRHSVYYTVSIDDNGTKRQVETNACFSSSFFSRFTCEEYNNRKIVGLYDPHINKFYIIRRIH